MLHFHILLVVLQQQEGGGNYFKWSESLCPKFSHLVTVAAPRYHGSKNAARQLYAPLPSSWTFFLLHLVCVCVPIQNSTTTGYLTFKWAFQNACQSLKHFQEQMRQYAISSGGKWRFLEIGIKFRGLARYQKLS